MKITVDMGQDPKFHAWLLIFDNQTIVGFIWSCHEQSITKRDNKVIQHKTENKFRNNTELCFSLSFQSVI